MVTPSTSLGRLLIIVVFLIGGCSKDPDRGSPEQLQDTSLPGVYAGTFPCQDCEAIQATLWLRSDGRFFFRQYYPGDNGYEATTAFDLGRWSWNADNSLIVLVGAGPRRALERPDKDTLIMQTESDLEHRLSLMPSAPDFSSTIRMAGMMSVQGKKASFTECLTGLEAPVDKGGDFARFLHQYRSVRAQGKPTYVELEGRFSWAGDGTLKSLIIERFGTVKVNGAC